MAVDLVKKRTKRYPRTLTVRVSEETKSMFAEMADEYEVADQVRPQIDKKVAELYKLFQNKKQKKSS